MAQKSKKDYEEYLNESGIPFDSLVYLTNPMRHDYISERTLRKKIKLNQTGSLLRKYDSIAFESGYNGWR